MERAIAEDKKFEPVSFKNRTRIDQQIYNEVGDPVVMVPNAIITAKNPDQLVAYSRHTGKRGCLQELGFFRSSQRAEPQLVEKPVEASKKEDEEGPRPMELPQKPEIDSERVGEESGTRRVSRPEGSQQKAAEQEKKPKGMSRSARRRDRNSK